MPEGSADDESEDTGLPDEQEDDCEPQDLLRMRQEDLE